MRPHVETHEEKRERLGRPVVASLSCHAALLVGMMVWTILSPPPFQFGEVDGDDGAAVAVTVLDGIEINVPRAAPNPVANPVEHQVPAPPEKPKPAPPKPAPPEEPEAVPLEDKKPPAQERRAQTKVQKSAPKTKPNQVPSTTGAQASNDLFSGTKQKGGAGVGLRGNNPFGQGYAWYATLLQEALSRSWGTTLGQASGKGARPTVVRFRILRNGDIADIRVLGTSGNRSVDYSAHRAVSNIKPFRALPPGLRRSSITVEMAFRLNP